MTTPLLQIEHLRVESDAGRPLLHDFSFDMLAGQCMAVVGESGSGKTMASRAILGLLPQGVHRAGGSIRLDGVELTALPSESLRAIRGKDIGMVLQEPMVSLNPAMTIARQMAEGLRLHLKLSDEEIHTRCIDMLKRVQIKDPERCLASHPHEFSGGMRQRIMLASVMLLKPKLLIADEPTTALDTLSQREVMELMVELTRDNNVAVLLITHDLGLVAKYSKRVVVLEKGVQVESGDARQILGDPQHPYTQRLVASIPRRATSRRTPVANEKPLLEIKGACIDYPGKPGLLGRGKPHRVVTGVDLNLNPGEIAAIVGASGSGKTTLGRAVLGLKPLSGGAIHFDGCDIARLNTEQTRVFRRQAQLVFQDPFSSLDPRMRIGEQIAAPLRHVAGVSPAERRERVEAVLKEVGLDGFATRFPHQMSGGQRQRVAIARAVVSNPRLIVADEPVSALDVTIQRQVLELFQRLQTQYNFACLFITHDLGVVEQIADRVYVMSGGQVVEQGDTDAVFDNPQHAYTKALLEATPSLAAAEAADI